jgi:hypothetical protein
VDGGRGGDGGEHTHLAGASRTPEGLNPKVRFLGMAHSTSLDAAALLSTRRRASTLATHAKLHTMIAALKAHVRQGRLVLDEPTDLPEGSEVPLSPAERHRFDHLMIKKALAEASPEDLVYYATVIAEAQKTVDGVDPWMEELDEDERAELARAIEEGLEESRGGKAVPNEEALRQIDRAKRAALSSR